MHKDNVKHLIVGLMLLMAARAILLYSDFLTSTILTIFAISVFTNETKND
jgi:hypothetical protein